MGMLSSASQQAKLYGTPKASELCTTKRTVLHIYFPRENSCYLNLLLSLRITPLIILRGLSSLPGPKNLPGVPVLCHAERNCYIGRAASTINVNLRPPVSVLSRGNLYVGALQIWGVQRACCQGIQQNGCQERAQGRATVQRWVSIWNASSKNA
jgi:hypothetical protein